MKRGKHVTKRFFPAEHTLSYSDMHLFVCMFVCVCSLADEHIVVPIEVFVCGEWKQKKNMCLSASTHSNDERCAPEGDPCESICSTCIQTHHSDPLDVVCTCCYWCCVSKMSWYFHNELHPFRLVLNTRSSVEQPNANGALSHNVYNAKLELCFCCFCRAQNINQ